MLEYIFDGTSKEFQIPDAAKQTLDQQIIDDEAPGTILRDFDALLEYIGDDGLPTSGKYHFFPQSKLDPLNALMTHPVVHRLKRPQQRSFPNLHGLYLLLRASGMGVGVGSPRGEQLRLESETVDAWRGLNAAERYFALLESWLVHGRPQVLAERGGWSNSGLSMLLYLTQRLRRQKTSCKDRHGVLYGTMDLVAASLMEQFGWLRLAYRAPAAGEGVKVESIERLPLGDAMIAALTVFSISDRLPMLYDDEPPEPGVLLPLFQPYFPELQQTLRQAEWVFREGAYTWRVSLAGASRKIVAPAQMSLDDLALTILDAFDFDDDHLYCFEHRLGNGRTLRIACPYEEDAAVLTDEMALGELPIAVGGTMTMVFDYGDNWQFDVQLEEIADQDDCLVSPRVIEKRGEAPAQYQWDE